MQPIQVAPINEGDQTVLLARVCDNDNDPLIQSDISSINVRSYDTNDRGNYINSADPTVASVIFDTLQDWPTVPGFTAPDTEGYNFKYVTPAAFFPQGKRTYQVEVKITLTDATVRTQIWIVPTTDLFQR